jgi:hypothetical protein
MPVRAQRMKAEAAPAREDLPDCGQSRRRVRSWDGLSSNGSAPPLSACNEWSRLWSGPAPPGIEPRRDYSDLTCGPDAAETRLSPDSNEHKCFTWKTRLSRAFLGLPRAIVFKPLFGFERARLQPCRKTTRNPLGFNPRGAVRKDSILPSAAEAGKLGPVIGTAEAVPFQNK